eukprot:6471535-Amphidinium_carterae.1
MSIPSGSLTRNHCLMEHATCLAVAVRRARRDRCAARHNTGSLQQSLMYLHNFEQKTQGHT